MQEPRFGRLEKVSLEAMWNGNGREFLSWLAREENLAYLGEMLNTTLQPDTMTEDKLRKDPMLVCLDRATNARYLILSPVVKTEDRGLGRLVVYAANFRPVNLIMMAGKFHPSHTKALSWLNQATNSDLNLFAMEVEFWRIGNSALAPNFSMVINPGQTVNGASLVKPPDIAKTPEIAAEPPKPPQAAPDDFDDDVFEPETGTLARLDSVFPSDMEDDQASVSPVEEERIESVISGIEASTEDDEPPISPSGMRRMFSSRRFSETITRNPSEAEEVEEIPPPVPESPPEPPEASDEMALSETSPIGKNSEGTENGGAPAPDSLASWDSLQQTSPIGADNPQVETTITPSGMLQRLQVRDSTTITEATAGTNSKKVVTSDEYIEFWTQFLTDVIEFDGEQPTRRSMSQGWISFPFDRDNFSLVAFLNKTHGLGGIGLVIDGPECKTHFASLLQEKSQIESELGKGLDWRELPEKEESHIYLHRKNVDISERSNWADYQNWFADALEAFMRVFGNRIVTLGSAIMWDD